MTSNCKNEAMNIITTFVFLKFSNFLSQKNQINVNDLKTHLLQFFIVIHTILKTLIGLLHSNN